MAELVSHTQEVLLEITDVAYQLKEIFAATEQNATASEIKTRVINHTLTQGEVRILTLLAIHKSHLPNGQAKFSSCEVNPLNSAFLLVTLEMSGNNDKSSFLIM